MFTVQLYIHFSSKLQSSWKIICSSSCVLIHAFGKIYYTTKSWICNRPNLAGWHFLCSRLEYKQCSGFEGSHSVLAWWTLWRRPLTRTFLCFPCYGAPPQQWSLFLVLLLAPAHDSQTFARPLSVPFLFRTSGQAGSSNFCLRITPKEKKISHGW